jgi:hypothetical protein
MKQGPSAQERKKLKKKEYKRKKKEQAQEMQRTKRHSQVKHADKLETSYSNSMRALHASKITLIVSKN